MTQEEKSLLFKDLCTRLPYHVHVKVWLKDGTTEEGMLDLKHNYGDVLRDAFFYKKIIDIKPYLRPMESMTDKECNRYDVLVEELSLRPGIESASNLTDWLNANHFDFRGLIPMNLALPAKEGMYNIEQKGE